MYTGGHSSSAATLSEPLLFESLAYVSNSALRFYFNGILWFRWQSKNRSLLAFSQTSQEHDLAVRKFQCIVSG